MTRILRKRLSLPLFVAILAVLAGHPLVTASPPANVAANNPAGIAFRGDTLVLAEAGKGRLLAAGPSGGTSVLAQRLIPGLFTRGATGVAVDGNGNAYVAVAEDGAVRYVTPSGESGIYARGLGLPYGLAFDASGNLYAADQAARRVLRVSPSREVSTFASGLSSSPFGLAFGSDGRLFVSTRSDGKVWRISEEGTPQQYLSIGSGSAEGIAFDEQGTLFVGDGAAGKVLRAAPPPPGYGAIATTFQTGFAGPINLAFHGTGLHVSAQGEGTGTTKDRVVRVDVATAGLPLAAPALTPSPLPAAPEHSVAHRGDGVALDPAPYLDVLPRGTATGVGLGAFEPTVGVTRTGAVFYNPKPTAGLNTQHVMRSRDQGKTWVDVSPKLPNGQIVPPTDLDPYIYVDRDTGRLFTVQLYVGCSYLAHSDDDGDNWITNPAACGIPGNDHQTVWSGPPSVLETVGYPNVVYYCYNAIAFSACGRSLDGGLSFHPAGVAYPPGGCAGLTGHVAVAPDGTVYLPKADCAAGPTVSVSRDDGTTWTRRVVGGPSFRSGDHEAHVAVDSSGNAYYTWVGPDGLPYLSVSKDAGTTWSEPVMVGMPGVTSAWGPSIAAGDRGRISVYYTATTSECCYAPRSGPERAWHSFVTTSIDADQPQPTFLSTTFNDPVDPIRRATCGPGRCGARPTSLGDFLEVYVDHTGRTWAAMVDTCTGTCGQIGLSGTNNAEAGMVGQLVRGPKLIGTGTLTPPPWFSG